MKMPGPVAPSLVPRGMPPQDLLALLQAANALIDEGAPQRALELAEQALAHAPALASAHAVRARALRRLGSPAQAVAAWQRAIELEPQRSEFHWGLGVALKAMGGDARPDYERAVELAPERFDLRRQLLILLLSRGLLTAAASHFSELTQRSDTPADLRGSAATAVTVLAEGARLRPALQAALDAKDPAALRGPVALAPAALLLEDKVLLARLCHMAQSTAQASVADPIRWDRQRAARPAWPLIEAHFEGHLGDTPAQVVESLRKAGSADAQAATARKLRELLVGARAVRERDSLNWLGLNGIDWECRLRYFHALMNAGQAPAGGGRFKAMVNNVHQNPNEPRGQPAEIVGTLRAFPARVLPLAGPGLVAAALWLYLLAKLHPFGDGNGGMGRFMASRELSGSGWGPLIVPDALREPVNEAIRHAHRTDELGELVAAIQRCLQWRDALLHKLERMRGGRGD